MSDKGLVDFLAQLQEQQNEARAEFRDAMRRQYYGGVEVPRLSRRLRLRWAVRSRVLRVRYRLAEWISPD